MAEATVATQFETLTSAARDLRATALEVAARSVAEMFWIPYVVFAACAPVVLPLPHHAPPPLPPLPGQAPAHDERQQ
jgi:vancomycin aglycone glucosyltransferase